MLKELNRIIIITLFIMIIAYVFKMTRSINEPVNVFPNMNYALQFSDPNEIDFNEVDDLSWLSIDVRPYNSRFTRSIWYKIPLPITHADTGIYFTEISSSSYTLYGSDGVILSQDSSENSRHNRFSLITHIPTRYSSSYLYLNLTTYPHFIPINNPIYIADHAQLEDMFNLYNITDVISGTILMLIGIIIILASFFFRKRIRTMNISLGILFVNFGFIMMFDETNIIYYMSRYHNLLYIFHIISILLAPLMLIYFYEASMISKHKSKLISWIKSIQIGYTATTLLTLLASIETHQRIDYPFIILYRYLFPVIVSLLALSLIIISFKESNEQRVHARIMLYGITMLAITFVANGITHLIPNSRYLSFTLWKLGLIMLLANALYIAIQQMSIYHQTKFKMQTNLGTSNLEFDHVTNLPNQMGSLRQLDLAIKNHKISGEIFSIALLNIDDLFSFNQSYGYSFGDNIIKTVVNLVSENLTNDTVIGRYTDAKFLIIMPNMNSSDAYIKLERIRELIKFTNFNDKGQMIHATVTIGLYEHQIEDDLDVTLSKMEQALYFGKHHGKDICSNLDDISGGYYSH